jgi:hypothetical protein
LFSGAPQEALSGIRSAITRFNKVTQSLTPDTAYELADGLAILILARLAGLQARFGESSSRDALSLLTDAEARLRSAATQDLVVCCDLYAGRILCDVGQPRRGLDRIRATRRTAARFAFPLYEISSYVEEGVALSDNGHGAGALAAWDRAEKTAQEHSFGLEVDRAAYLRAAMWSPP